MDVEAKNALWLEVVGNNMLIPGVNSNVLYRARLHFHQTDGLADEVNPVLPLTIPAIVTSVQMEFVEGSGYPMVKFLLAPRQREDENRDGGHNFFMEGIARHHVFDVYEKEVSITEIGGYLPTQKVGANFFPHNPVKAFVVFGDGSKHGFCFKNGQFSGREWNEFVNDKKMMIGDRFVFLKRRQGGGDVYLGLKRALPPSSSGQLVVDAARLAAKGSNF